jgi:AAA+ superfamily predicted ATPase
VGEDEYRGLYVSADDADRIAADGDGGCPAPAAEDGLLAAARAELEALVEAGEGRLGRLRATAGLNQFEAGCVLLALASESDLGLERLVAYVQDDVTKRRPRVELAVRLFAPDGGQGDALAAFLPGAPLRKRELIRLLDEPGQPQTPLLAQYVALDPRVVAYLLGHDAMDERLLPFAHTSPHALAEARPMASGDLLRVVESLADLPAAALPNPVLALAGPDDAERLLVARLIARGSGLETLRISIDGLAAEHGLDTALTLACRDAAFQEAAAILEGVDQLKASDADRLRERLREDPLSALVFLSSRLPFNWPGLALEIPGLDFRGLRIRWSEYLGDDAPIDGAELDALAGKFKLGTANVADAVEAARGTARHRDARKPLIRIEDLYAAARTQSTPILNDLARKIVPHYAWDDLILPEDPREQLREICAQMEHRHQVYETWGMGRKLAMGKGLMALFAGNSGTGKTMAADVIAGTLGLDLYKIDLSGVVSKYIGETEKNLASIFAEAETSNAILFFDEADALFGKRSEVKDAHDRYANIETAYLLQKMEEYSGIVVLATNLKMNLDEAFLRRLHFVVDFPMPEEEDRLRIWRTTIPELLPLAGDVDLAFMARQFKIAGGNIRNIVLAAAFLAAGEGEQVGMRHFIRSTRREYQKLSRMVTDQDFGPYVHILRE